MSGLALQLLDLGERDERLEQVVEVLPGLGRHVDELGVAAPVGRRQALLGQLAADAVGVGALLVDLVDGDHHRHAGGLGVVDRLDGLRHHAVVGRHHDHRDVGDLGAAGAHGREGLVAGRVEEGDRVVVVVDLVGADVLRDAAGLAGGHLGLADRVEQRGLAVVDVAHDRDHRRAVDQVLVGVLVGRLVLGVLGRRRSSRPSCRSASASTSIASSDSVWVSVAISPSSISFLITSGAPSWSDSATSLTVEPERTWTAGSSGCSASSFACASASRSGSTHWGRRRRPRPRRGGWDCCGGGRAVAPGGLGVDHHAPAPAAAATVAALRPRRGRRAPGAGRAAAAAA